MQLCASSNGNCNRSTHLKIYIYMYIWSTQEKMQLCASSNGNCNRSTHLKFRSRASRGVSRQQVRIRKHRHVNTHGSTTQTSDARHYNSLGVHAHSQTKNVSKKKRKVTLIKNKNVSCEA